MSLLFTLLAFVSLAAGTYRQSTLLLGEAATPLRRRRLLLLGYSLLGASVIPVCTNPDWARRLVEWFGQLSAAALLVVLLCWYRARAPRRP